MAAAAAAPHSDLECPVCHEDFSEPKLLPCTHSMCKGCVLSWLKAKGQGGCPLCRVPILPKQGPFTQHKQKKTSIEHHVDNLPTDLATMALVESRRALDGDDVCSVCADVTAVTSFCLECSIKLCKACADGHVKVSTTRDHVLEDLGTLTAERLATSRRVPCETHHEATIYYCCTHEAPICPSCRSSTHNTCTVAELAKQASQACASLTDQTRRLRTKESVLATKINELRQEVSDAQAHFAAMRQEVNATCDRLQQTVERKRTELNNAIRQQEECFVSPIEDEKSFLEEHRASLAAHAVIGEHLLDISSSTTLLGTLRRLKARLDNLESRARQARRAQTSPPWTLSMDEDLLSYLEQSIGEVGHVLFDSDPSASVVKTADTCYYCGNKLDDGEMYCAFCGFSVSNDNQDVYPLRAPDTATTLKVGDRVRMTGNAKSNKGPFRLAGEQPGTVIHVGQGTGYKGAGWVLVRWDKSGRAKWQRHGGGGKYEVTLLMES